MGWLKRFLATRAGKAVSVGAIGKFLADHRKTIASGFFAVSAWAFWRDCGVVTYSGVTVDVLAILQRYFPGLICVQIKDALQVAAAFLFGLGVADRREWMTNFLLPRKAEPAVAPAVP